jgi:hypothetical protein
MAQIPLADLDPGTSKVREALLAGGSVATHVAASNPHPQYALASGTVPGTEVASVEVSTFGGSPFSFTSTVDITGLAITLPDIARPIWVRLYLSQVWSTVAGGSAVASITTSSNTSYNTATGVSPTSNYAFTLCVWARIPAHTPASLKARINGSGNAGGINATAGLFVNSLAAFAA